MRSQEGNDPKGSPCMRDGALSHKTDLMTMIEKAHIA